MDLTARNRYWRRFNAAMFLLCFSLFLLSRSAAEAGYGLTLQAIAQFLGVTQQPWTPPTVTNQVPVATVTNGTTSVAWGTVPGGGSTPNLGAVVAQGNTVNGTSPSTGIAFANGGTWDGSTAHSQIVGSPSDGQTFFITVPGIGGLYLNVNSGVSVSSDLSVGTQFTLNEMANPGLSAPGTAVIYDDHATHLAYISLNAGAYKQLASCYPTGFLSGGLYSYASATTINVTGSSWRDKADLYDVRAQAAGTVTTTASGANGFDSFAASGITATTSGTGGLTASGSIISTLGTRALTITSWSTSTTTLTGVFPAGSSFLGTVAVGDLVGNSSVGYIQVTAIPSSTTLTLDVAFSALGGSATSSGTTLNVIENPTLQPATNAGDVRQVLWIGSNGTAIACDAATSNWSGTLTSVALHVGACPALQSSTKNWWGNVWLESGGSGNTIVLSSQRTTPYLVTGYTTSVRRSGAFPFTQNSSTTTALLCYAYQQAMGSGRLTYFECAQDAANTEVLNGGTAATWTTVYLGNVVPPTATQVVLNFYFATSSVSAPAYVRARAVGDSAISRNNLALTNSTSNFSTAWLLWETDAAQCLEYACPSSAGGHVTLTIAVQGFEENP